LLWAKSSDDFFISQSPETLFSHSQRVIKVDSLAGTIKQREQDNTQGEKHSLANSAKDLKEHRIVTEFLKEKLDQLCDTVEITSKESIISLNYVHHIQTTLKGNLKKDVTNSQLLAELHPTPAIVGAPQKRVVELLPTIEIHERNYYAAPFGVITQNSAEFLITIRAAHFRKGTLSLYAGAGIVEDSTANQEWEETTSKMEAIRQLL
jgi:menaquinone-specific isochorismate synthase